MSPHEPPTSMTPSALHPEMKVADIVASHPSLARMFEQVGIDYCCGGKRTLAEACSDKDLDPRTLVVMLEATMRTAGASEPMVDAARLSLTGLADHIERTHHAYLKTELPRLADLAARVAVEHAASDGRLNAVRDTVNQLAAEMYSHMGKEENVLFPLVRRLDAGSAGDFHCGSIAYPIRQMESEHDAAGSAVACLRELTDGFTPAPGACNTHHALLAGLAQLERDLHEHVHKENNILFPRAIALEQSQQVCL
ncbi:MAG: iron-sulfur cluster repair di-iron protein [Opitutaceae bacterium]|nr:iron-sulfur cluster repair di-iron protein [Opitutaceae bacterium]